MLIKSIIGAIATSALALKLVRNLSQQRQLRRVRDDRQRHREDVNRWEAEGGNLPSRPPASR